MHKVISMTNIQTKRGRTLGDDEAAHKFIQLKMAGSYKGSSVIKNEVHEKWIDHCKKEYTVIYKEE